MFVYLMLCFYSRMPLLFVLHVYFELLLLLLLGVILQFFALWDSLDYHRHLLLLVGEAILDPKGATTMHTVTSLILSTAILALTLRIAACTRLLSCLLL